MGEMGFGGITASARNSLPKYINSQYLHKDKTAPTNKPAKVAYFTRPIITVEKIIESRQHIYISFQSTSLCYI